MRNTALVLLALSLANPAWAQDMEPPLSEAIAQPALEPPALERTRITLRLPLPGAPVTWTLPLEAYDAPTPQPAGTPAPTESPAPTPAETPAALDTPTPAETPAAEGDPTPTPAETPTALETPTPAETPAELTPITGILTWPGSDRPAANRPAKLIDVDTGRTIATTTTDAAGAYTFPPQPPGNYRVEMERKIRRPE